WAQNGTHDNFRTHLLDAAPHWPRKSPDGENREAFTARFSLSELSWVPFCAQKSTARAENRLQDHRIVG
ncbi:hypothetical protein, partial [Eggerthella sp.]|uniref:hypothetical protein n=1 Tax=Eggerthella sp. TaxID=1929886 RepID=UPI003AB6F28C